MSIRDLHYQIHSNLQSLFASLEQISQQAEALRNEYLKNRRAFTDILDRLGKEDYDGAKDMAEAALKPDGTKADANTGNPAAAQAAERGVVPKGTQGDN